MSNLRNPDEWHLEKRVTITLIIAMVTQAITLGWFAATLNANVMANRKDIDVHARYIAERRLSDSDNAERMARVETTLIYLTKLVERMEKRSAE